MLKIFAYESPDPVKRLWAVVSVTLLFCKKNTPKYPLKPVILRVFTRHSQGEHFGVAFCD